jgi:hypothetical protein
MKPVVLGPQPRHRLRFTHRHQHARTDLSPRETFASCSGHIPVILGENRNDSQRMTQPPDAKPVLELNPHL